VHAARTITPPFLFSPCQIYRRLVSASYPRGGFFPLFFTYVDNVLGAQAEPRIKIYVPFLWLSSFPRRWRERVRLRSLSHRYGFLERRPSPVPLLPHAEDMTFSSPWSYSYAQGRILIEKVFIPHPAGSRTGQVVFSPSRTISSPQVFRESLCKSPFPTSSPCPTDGRTRSKVASSWFLAVRSLIYMSGTLDA